MKTTARRSISAQGAFMRVELRWDDAARKVSLRLAAGSRVLRPIPLEIKLAGSDRATKAVFTGDPLTVRL